MDDIVRLMLPGQPVLCDSNLSKISTELTNSSKTIRHLLVSIIVSYYPKSITFNATLSLSELLAWGYELKHKSESNVNMSGMELSNLSSEQWGIFCLAISIGQVCWLDAGNNHLSQDKLEQLQKITRKNRMIKRLLDCHSIYGEDLWLAAFDLLSGSGEIELTRDRVITVLNKINTSTYLTTACSAMISDIKPMGQTLQREFQANTVMLLKSLNPDVRLPVLEILVMESNMTHLQSSKPCEVIELFPAKDRTTVVNLIEDVIFNYYSSNHWFLFYEVLKLLSPCDKPINLLSKLSVYDRWAMLPGKEKYHISDFYKKVLGCGSFNDNETYNILMQLNQETRKHELLRCFYPLTPHFSRLEKMNELYDIVGNEIFRIRERRKIFFAYLPMSQYANYFTQLEPGMKGRTALDLFIECACQQPSLLERCISSIPLNDTIAESLTYDETCSAARRLSEKFWPRLFEVFKKPFDRDAVFLKISLDYSIDRIPKKINRTSAPGVNTYINKFLLDRLRGIYKHLDKMTEFSQLLSRLTLATIVRILTEYPPSNFESSELISIIAKRLTIQDIFELRQSYSHCLSEFLKWEPIRTRFAECDFIMTAIVIAQGTRQSLDKSHNSLTGSPLSLLPNEVLNNIMGFVGRELVSHSSEKEILTRWEKVLKSLNQECDNASTLTHSEDPSRISGAAAAATEEIVSSNNIGTVAKI